MKVKDMIEELQKYPEDTEVVMEYRGFDAMNECGVEERSEPHIDYVEKDM